MSNGNLHSHAPLPIAVLGGKACNVKGNRHITNPDLTPIENLHVSLAQRAGVDIETFGREHSAPSTSRVHGLGRSLACWRSGWTDDAQREAFGLC